MIRKGYWKKTISEMPRHQIIDPQNKYVSKSVSK